LGLAFRINRLLTTTHQIKGLIGADEMNLYQGANGTVVIDSYTGVILMVNDHINRYRGIVLPRGSISKLASLDPCEILSLSGIHHLNAQWYDPDI